MAVTAGYPANIFERAGDGTWAAVPDLSAIGSCVGADGNDAYLGGDGGGVAVRRGAAGVWESQHLPGSTVTAAVGGGKIALASSTDQVQIYGYDSSPRLLYSNFDAGTDLADLGFTTHTDSYGRVAAVDGSLSLYRSTSGTVATVGVSKTLDCQDLVTFTFEYTGHSGGSLQMSLGGVVLDTISTTGYVRIDYRRTFNLADLGLSPGQLQWNLDSNTQAIIDNLYITTNVPEPATLALLAAGGLAMLRRRR